MNNVETSILVSTSYAINVQTNFINSSVSDYLLHLYLAYLCETMKLTHYILAIYTLLLSCIPCQDEMIVSMDQTDNVTIVDTNQNVNDQHALDLCSPFCICACCSGITLQHTVSSLPILTFFAFPEEKTFAYIQRTDSGDLTSIWQPPRIQCSHLFMVGLFL